MSRRPAKIVLAGGSGFLGRTLAEWFAAKGWEVAVLSRSSKPAGAGPTVCWDGKHIGDWVRELEEALVLVNLSGRSVNCRYTARNRRQILSSRIDSTRVLGEAVRRCAKGPEVWLNLSTATIYEHTFGEGHDEQGAIAASPEAKDAFSIEVARAWEQAFAEVAAPGVRKLVLRTAMVLGRQPGGVYQVLRRLVRLGLGGRMASGKQYVSWIHETDFCRAVEWLIAHSNANGIYNISAPVPVANAELMAAFRRSEGVALGLPATKLMLEFGAFFLRTETELVIKSRRVIPRRLLTEGFEFTYPHIEPALESLAAAEKHASTA